MNNHLNPLTIENRDLINSYLSKFPPEISEHTFTNLFVWRQARPVWTMEFNNSLLFLIDFPVDPENKILFGPAVGAIDVVDVLNAFPEKVTAAVRIPENKVDVSSDLAPQKVYLDRDNADYVYLVSDLAELSGRKFAKKRNHIKQCLKAHNCNYEVITERNISECIDFQNKWCELRNCSVTPGLCAEFKAIQEVFTHYNDFDLFGGAIRVDGEIMAFTIGERLNHDTAVCHFEKAMPTINGLNQLINKWFAEKSLIEFKYINREQDLGIPGLRQAKESYFPHHLVMKYLIHENDTTSYPQDQIHRCGDV